MERVIKFRGKCAISGEFVYGDLIHGVASKEGNIYILPNKRNLASVKHCDPLDGVRVDPKTVGQFTGLLKGKQGEHEIFEGNIYKWGWSVERIGVVKFNTSYAGWGLEYKVGTGTMFRSLTPEFIEEMEYVGNVHEHPHLIK